MHSRDLIRFVTSDRHPPYGHRSGIFVAAYAASRDRRLPEEAGGSELRALLEWFSKNLAKPERFAASRHLRAKETGISWIRASACEHVSHLRRLAALVETAGFMVEELRTTRPGYVLYQDKNQVVALPFADTRR